MLGINGRHSTLVARAQESSMLFGGAAPARAPAAKTMKVFRKSILNSDARALGVCQPIRLLTFRLFARINLRFKASSPRFNTVGLRFVGGSQAREVNGQHSHEEPF